MLVAVASKFVTRARMTHCVGKFETSISPIEGSFRQQSGNSSTRTAYAREPQGVSDQGNRRGRNEALSVATTFGNSAALISAFRTSRLSISTTSDELWQWDGNKTQKSAYANGHLGYPDQDFSNLGATARVLLAPPRGIRTKVPHPF
jgi:hypothetical protein